MTWNKKALTARKADKFSLYQLSVQEPSWECAFIDRVYRKRFQRRPLVLREDFCGTAAVCCAWVQSKWGRTAYGVDLDPSPLTWAREHNLARLNPLAQSSVTLLQQDVRRPGPKNVDVIAAQNFSWMVFQTRAELRDYFKKARRNLNLEGMLVLDTMGGPGMMEEGLREKRRRKGFTYIWEQERFDPIRQNLVCHIHFGFPDGTEMRRAFTYDWRLWMLPDVVELLTESGFGRVDVYWEDAGLAGKGTGVYRLRKKAQNEKAWVAYLVATP